MRPEGAILGPWGIAVMVGYLVSLLLLGWMGRQAQKEKTLADVYLGGAASGSLCCS